MTLTKTFFVVCLLATGALDDPPKKDDAESFKGTWRALSVNKGGQNIPEEFVKSMTFKFDGKKYDQKVQDQSDEEGDYSIDASQSPKTIDLDIKTGNDQGKKQLGIYKFEDGKLTFVVALAGSKDRPKSFKVEKKDVDVVEFVLEREKS